MQPEAAFPNDWETNPNWVKWKKPTLGKQRWFKAVSAEGDFTGVGDELRTDRQRERRARESP
jgi:hypothetical protein